MGQSPKVDLSYWQIGNERQKKKIKGTELDCWSSFIYLFNYMHKKMNLNLLLVLSWLWKSRPFSKLMYLNLCPNWYNTKSLYLIFHPDLYDNHMELKWVNKRSISIIMININTTKIYAIEDLYKSLKIYFIR